MSSFERMHALLVINGECARCQVPGTIII